MRRKECVFERMRDRRRERVRSGGTRMSKDSKLIIRRGEPDRAVMSSSNAFATFSIGRDHLTAQSLNFSALARKRRTQKR